MTPTLTALAKANRELSAAYRRADLDAIRELTAVRDELRDIIESGTDRLLMDIAAMARVMA